DGASPRESLLSSSTRLMETIKFIRWNLFSHGHSMSECATSQPQTAEGAAERAADKSPKTFLELQGGWYHSRIRCCRGDSPAVGVCLSRHSCRPAGLLSTPCRIIALWRGLLRPRCLCNHNPDACTPVARCARNDA